ncbi:MAG: calcium/sodium antiporter [Coriobacteriia bacterium]|nr:calcium/sodium antiporter [Coriobacteriia bacterium]
MMYAYALGGLVLLFGGAEWLVRGALAVARRFKISPLLIGMTVVAFCTSAPEMVVSLGAAIEGRSDIAIGNIVGSNTFNILGVLGAAALIAPMAVKPRELRRDTATMIAAALALTIMAQFGTLTRFMGLLLFTGIVAYVWLSYRYERRNPTSPSADLHSEEAEEIPSPKSLWVGIGLVSAGLACLVVGSRLLIVGATDIALTLGISEAVIGLTLVAIGTSLPELATSIVAAFRRHSDVAVGNVVGSNIFNILGILGISSLVRPIDVAAQMARVDVWVMLAVTVGLAPFLLIRGRIGRITGVAFLTIYVAYAVLLFNGSLV